MKYGFSVFLVFLISTFVAPALAATYYFSTSGSDANNGLSSASPKKSIAAANELMRAGNIILFKRGDTWYFPKGTIKLDNRSNFSIDAYGNGSRPVIAGLALISENWNYEGNNVWSSSTGYNEALRVFVGGISRISLNDKAGNEAIVKDLDATDEYLFDKPTGKLYIFQSSSKSAPTDVTMIPAWPAPPLVSMLNTKNVKISNIEFQGGGNIATIRISAPSANILISKCVVTRSNLMGIFALNSERNMNVVENLVIEDCVVDKAWTKEENNLKPTVKLKGDGIAFMHGVKNSVIRNCKIRNWGHDGISIIATEYITGIYGVKYNKIEGNDISAGNSAYMHGFSVEGFKDLAMYNIFKRNYCHGFSSTNTIGGNTNFVFSNIFENLTVSPLPQHTQNAHAINLSTWSIKDKSGNLGSLESKNNWVVNNTINNTDTYSILVDRSNTDGDETTLLDNKIYNNLLLNFGLDTSFTRDRKNSNPPPRLGLRILVNVNPARTFVRNNNFWADWEPSGERRVALYGRGSYNAAQLNNCSECGGGNVARNTQLNPHLGKFYKLTPASGKALTSGGYSYVSAIVQAGLPAAELVDYYGKPFPTDGISVGAIQY